MAMELSQALHHGLATALSWSGLPLVLLGTALAMVTSFLPGIGNASMAVMALLLTLNWDPESVLLLFGAITGGATFMGSITAILFNIPGSVSSTPALLDGYPMGQRGYVRTAIACAATASALGSLIGVAVLLALLPWMRHLLVEFGVLELLLVAMLGLLTVVTIPTRSVRRSLLMAALGLVLSMVGADPGTGHVRWSMGMPDLGDGIALVPMMLGIFTVSEIMEWMNSRQLPQAWGVRLHPQDSSWNGVRTTLRHPGLVLRSSLIGTLVGMIPGIGGTVAGFLAYGHAVQSSTDRSRFGQGDARGLIAPEAAVDAKDGGALLPTLALGLPGSEACVILLAVLTAHGLTPGISLLSQHLPLTLTLVCALLLSNVLTSLMGVALSPWLARLRHLRFERLALLCLLVCLLSTLALQSRPGDLYILLFFGVAGYFWRSHGWPRIPFVIAFVLGPVIEKNGSLALQLIALGRIDPAQRMVSAGLAVMMAVCLAWLFWRWVRGRLSTVPPIRADMGSDNRADLSQRGIALVMSLVLSVMAAVAWRDPQAYSLYARVVVATAWFLCWPCLWIWDQAVPRAQVWSDLLPLPGHGKALLLILCFVPMAWALGLAAAMPILALAWLWPASQPCALVRRMAILGSLVFAGAGCWLLDQWLASIGLIETSRGWLWTRIFLP